MKTKYFKDGNPDIYKYFNDVIWKRLTDAEKAKWTPYSEAEQAPIPQEVLDFQEERKTLEAELAELKAQVKANKTKVEPEPVDEPEPESVNELTLEPDQERVLLLEECRKRGIKVTHNMKLETLKKKLEDAND